MAAKSQDKILCGVAALLLLGSAGWMFAQKSKLASIRQPSGSITPTPYVPAGIDAPAVTTQVWPPAPPQSRGAEWVYDVFTSPEIYYSKEKGFTVTPPSTTPTPTPPPIPFGVELVQVKQDVFGLQLVGYIVAGKDDFRGNFENAVSGETIIGRAGKKIPALGLTIKSFEVRRNEVKVKGETTTYEMEAVAVIVDDATGKETSLTNKRRLVTGTPIAVLKIDGGDTVQQKADTKFTAGNATFNVVSVTSEPASAVVRKESPELTEPLTKTLTLPAPAAPTPDGAAPAPAPAAAPAASPFPSFPTSN